MVEIEFIVGIIASGIRMSTPVLFAALGENIAERAGILNLGVEGMMLIGAFVGFVGTYFSGSILVGLLLAVIGPMVMATLMAFLSVSLRTNQLVAGLAIWLLGAGLARFTLQANLWCSYDSSPYRSTTCNFYPDTK